ncbi:unnamed protein product, partial [Ectocarpus sp. 8 AP-2014]
RREDLELLTTALAGQESDLRCWGYVSVLASFKEHRRREANRAQLRVGMSERREEVITAKLQEVGRLLRSMPIIGPWTNKPAGAETESLGFRGGIGGDGRFWEEAFAVSPEDLLAFDEDLALARQRLVACDRACAAAADAFAMKVVAAGGLEPRSPEDRAQALLSLLSRYHVLELGESVVSGEEETGQDQPTVKQDQPTAKSSPQDPGGTQVEEDREEAGKQQPREEEGEAETRNPETERVPAENTGRPIERRRTVEEEADQGRQAGLLTPTSRTSKQRETRASLTGEASRRHPKAVMGRHPKMVMGRHPKAVMGRHPKAVMAATAAVVTPPLARRATRVVGVWTGGAHPPGAHVFPGLAERTARWRFSSSCWTSGI